MYVLRPRWIHLRTGVTDTVWVTSFLSRQIWFLIWDDSGVLVIILPARLSINLVNWHARFNFKLLVCSYTVLHIDIIEILVLIKKKIQCWYDIRNHILTNGVMTWERLGSLQEKLRWLCDGRIAEFFVKIWARQRLWPSRCNRIMRLSANGSFAGFPSNHWWSCWHNERQGRFWRSPRLNNG